MEGDTMKEVSPIIQGLLRIHKIISRGLSTSIRKCDEYLVQQSIPPMEAAGFSMYVSTLKWVTHAHHLGEEEIAFPYFKDYIEAPYNSLKDDHHAIAQVLDTLDQCLLEISIRQSRQSFVRCWVNSKSYGYPISGSRKIISLLKN